MAKIDGHLMRKMTLSLLAALLSGAAYAADWPQWRGPDRTGVSRETGLLKSWPPEGPKLVWKAEGLGGGYSTPSIANGRIYGMGYQGDDEVVWALEAASGKPLWRTRIAAANHDIGYDDGPRSTPTVDGDRIYTLGVSGDLVCLNAVDGRLLWQKNLVREFGGSVPHWGYAESPLIDGDRVVVTPGGRAATLVALNKANGEVLWRCPVPGGDPAAYSSCILADVGGQRQIIQFLSRGVVGVSAQDGQFLWRFNAPACDRGIQCSTPIYHDNHVFAASAYRHGGALGRLTNGPDGMTAEQVYFTRQMQNHHGGMILVGDYLYGFNESTLTCLKFKTGEVMWEDRSVNKGSLGYADGMLYARGERGSVALVEATPSGYVEKGRFDQPDRSGKSAWPHPVIANGRLYLRDQDILLCYDVKAR